MVNDKHIFTYQTRLELDSQSLNILDQYAHLYSKVKRSLFADISAGHPARTLKKEYLKKYGITARQFNGCRTEVEGKISSIEQLRTILIRGLKRKIKSFAKRITSLSKRRRQNKEKIHHKKRKLKNLEYRLAKLEQDKENNITRICFGGKKLFHAQFNLEANGYASHEEWKEDWVKARGSEFFVLGSKDETSGNQSCAASIDESGNINIRLRLPHALVSSSKYLTIKDLSFKYGHSDIINAIREWLQRKEVKYQKGEFKDFGKAINYRFKRDEKGWRVFLSVAKSQPNLNTLTNIGVLGVDLNVDHLAITETDRFGNIISTKTIDLHSYGKTKNQAKAIIGDASAELVSLALKLKKPLVIENLDFQDKRESLEKEDPKHSRMISSFAYNNILTSIKSRSWRLGVEIKEVNPAYTSLIGRFKFSKRYGLTTHHAAALVIGRRCQGFSENPPKSLSQIPDGRGDYVALSLPARKRDKHVWSFWGEVRRKFQTALAAHFRAKRSSDPPKGDLCDNQNDSRKLLVKLQHVNRLQNCLVDVSG